MDTPSDDPVRSLEGWLERIRPGAVSGWVWDPSRPDERHDVEVWLDDAMLGTVRADRERPDLAKAGIGDGRYGFSFVPQSPLADADLTRLVALVPAGDTGAPFRVKSLEERPTAADVEHALARLQAMLGSVADRHERALDEISAQVQALARRLDALAAEPDGRCASGASLHAVDEEFERRLSTLETMLARIDELVAEAIADKPHAGASRRARPATLTVALIVVGLLAGGMAGYLVRGL